MTEPNPFALNAPPAAPAAPAPNPYAQAPAAPPAPNPYAPPAAPAPNPYAQAPAAQPFAPGGAVPPAQFVAPPAPVPAQAPTAAPMGGADPFSGPAPQAPRAPRFREMYGRLVLLIPRKLETGVVSRTFTNQDGTPAIQDRLTADIIVLDGGPITYGGAPEKVPPIPHTMTENVPHRWPNAYISFGGIISQCRVALSKIVTEGRPGMVLGRVTRGTEATKGEPPWLLSEPTEADKAIARAYLATVDPFGA